MGCTLEAVIGRECRDGSCVEIVPQAAQPCDDSACVALVDCDASRDHSPRTGLDIHVLIEASGAMFFSWAETRQGLEDFLYDPASSAIGVGLQLYGESCDPQTYATPSVPIEALPGHAPTLMASFPIVPTQHTPTRPALEGALDYAQSWQRDHPERVVIVVLVTGSSPEECDSDAQGVADVAADAWHASPPIRTHVIGINVVADAFRFVSAVTTLSGIPFETVPARSAADLTAALRAVRDTELACLSFAP